MPTDAMRKAIKKYQAEKLENITFRVPRGEKAVIQNHAAAQGESVRAFLLRAAKETMQRDKAGTD